MSNNEKDALEFIEQLINLAKKHKVDSLEHNGTKIQISKHEHTYDPLRDGASDQVKLEDEFTSEDDLLFHSSDE